MTDFLDPRDHMSIPPEAVANADKSGGFLLLVPDHAERDNRGVTRWTETIVIESAKRSEVVGKDDQQNTVFTVKAKVLPTEGTVNAGKTLMLWMRINFGALAGRTDTSGKKDAGKQRTMSNMSLKKLNQFARATGIDLSAGWTPEIFDALFPLDTALNGESALDGQNLVVVMIESTRNGKTNQEPESILAVEGM